jgi:hypothetical protein
MTLKSVTSLKNWNCDTVVDCHRVLIRWRNYFSQLQDVHWFNNVRQTGIPAAEPLVSDTSAFENELVIGKL